MLILFIILKTKYSLSKEQTMSQIISYLFKTVDFTDLLPSTETMASIGVIVLSLSLIVIIWGSIKSKEDYISVKLSIVMSSTFVPTSMLLLLLLLLIDIRELSIFNAFLLICAVVISSFLHVFFCMIGSNDPITYLVHATAGVSASVAALFIFSIGSGPNFLSLDAIAITYSLVVGLLAGLSSLVISRMWMAHRMSRHQSGSVN